MIEYSHQNTFTFGYDGGVLNEKTGASGLAYSMARCTRAPFTLKEEFKHTAELLYQKAQKLGRQLYVLQSGGLDSEVMLNSFIAAKVPFTPITFELANGMNTHEMQYVRKFGLNTMFYPIDLLPWLKTSQAHDWFHLSKCDTVAMLPHMKLLHHIWFNLGGMPVLGGGDVVVLRHQGKWMYSKYEYMLAWYWFMHKMGIDGGVAFFQHTPETTLAMLNEPLMLRAGRGLDDLANKLLPDLRQIKYRVYHQHWELRKRPKFNGAELTFAHTRQCELLWQAEQPFKYNAIWSIPFEEFRCSLIS